MAYRNKTYVCFDGDKDIQYYYLMKAWKQNDNTAFNFYDAHELNTARDTSLENSIKVQLRKRMSESKVFVVLIGESTKHLYKFVRWEMELAIEMNLPIICVNLNGLKKRDENRCPPILKDQLAIHINYRSAILQHALENWPNLDKQYRSEGKTGPFHHNDSVYNNLQPTVRL